MGKFQNHLSCASSVSAVRWQEKAHERQLTLPAQQINKMKTFQDRPKRPLLVCVHHAAQGHSFIPFRPGQILSYRNLLLIINI